MSNIVHVNSRHIPMRIDQEFVEGFLSIAFEKPIFEWRDYESAEIFISARGTGSGATVKQMNGPESDATMFLLHGIEHELAEGLKEYRKKSQVCSS